MGCPQANARSTQMPNHTLRSMLPVMIAMTTSPRAWLQPELGLPSQSASSHTQSRSADRLTPFHIWLWCIVGPFLLSSQQFQALFDNLLEVWSLTTQTLRKRPYFRYANEIPSLFWYIAKWDPHKETYCSLSTFIQLNWGLKHQKGKYH